MDTHQMIIVSIEKDVGRNRASSVAIAILILWANRCHTVYALKVQARDGSLWVNVGQTKDYHSRVSAKKALCLKRGAQVLSHKRIKSGLTRLEATDLERRLLNKGFSRTGLPVLGR
jgi:hypothetical protein